MSHDVIVVGGGPAGSVTAMLLARAGYDVLLLERQQFPRAKPCGDCVSPGANAILHRLGVWDDVLRAGPAMLDGWKMTTQSGVTFSVSFSELAGAANAAHGIAIRRELFDSVLLAHAQRAGVRVTHGAHVTDLLYDRRSVAGVRVRSDEGVREIRARAVVGADGLRSIVARRLNAHTRAPRLTKTSFTLHTSLASAHSFGEMRLGDRACLGIAPVDGQPHGTHNVTLVLQSGSFDARRGAKHIFQQGLRQFGLEVQLNGDRLLTSGPFDWPIRAVSHDGAALVGDAAGYYDPFTGQGIYQALAGAELLAGHLDAALRKGPAPRRALAGYEQEHRQLYAATRRLQRIVEFICARPRLADYAFGKCRQNGDAARELIAATGDLIPAESLFSARFLMRLFR